MKHMALDMKFRAIDQLTWKRYKRKGNHDSSEWEFYKKEFIATPPN